MNLPNFRFRMTPRGVDSPYAKDGTFWVRPDGGYYQLDHDYLLGATPTGPIRLAQPITADAVKDRFTSSEPTWHVSEVVEVALAPGQYHPRIWRQFACPPPAEAYQREFTSDIVNFDLLERELENLFLVIEPYKGSSNPSPNEMAFGHGIRSLLILACTEVENLLKRVMTANGGQSIGAYWNTKDYAKTYPVLKLGDITSRLIRYPDYPPLRPFHGWDRYAATKSLDWYDAYNSTKHDRMEGLKDATFSRAINAVAAVHVLLTAQYGVGLIRANQGRFTMKTEDYHSRIFVNEDLPFHPLATQYIPPFNDQEQWSQVALPGEFP